jgi:predicted ester cyclase
MVERIIVEENTVVVDYTWSGTHIGVYNGIKPSNRYFEMPTVWLFDFKAGKVVYAKRLVDNHVFTRLVHMKN